MKLSGRFQPGIARTIAWSSPRPAAPATLQHSIQALPGDNRIPGSFVISTVAIDYRVDNAVFHDLRDLFDDRVTAFRRI